MGIWPNIGNVENLKEGIIDMPLATQDVLDHHGRVDGLDGLHRLLRGNSGVVGLIVWQGEGEGPKTIRMNNTEYVGVVHDWRVGRFK